MTEIKDEVAVPPARSLIWPVVRAVRELGGSGRNDEINAKVVELEGFTDEQQQFDGRGNGLELEYRLGWARSLAKKIDLLDNVGRAVWALTKDGQEVDESEVEPRWLAFSRGRKRPSATASTDEADTDESVQPWQTEALNVLRAMDPAAFERLCQRLLRQAGFVNVVVTGRSGDGGIDGTGVYRMALVSFPVFFQCKRYSGTVSPGEIRDFRGAMIGRGDKGLFITTGSFTPGARAEATRDGAPPLDLIDGDELVELLREYRLGITTAERIVQDVTVHPEFFGGV